MAEEQKEELAEGTLLSHLTELRNRLFKAFGAVFVLFLAQIPFAKDIYNFASAPLANVVPGGKLQSFEALGPLTATFGLLFYMAIFLAMPVILYQAWAFIAPGLFPFLSDIFRMLELESAGVDTCNFAAGSLRNNCMTAVAVS